MSFADVARGIGACDEDHGVRLAPASSISDSVGSLQDLMIEFNKLNSLVDINLMLSTVRQLNNRLAACTTNGEKFQVFVEVLNSLN